MWALLVACSDPGPGRSSGDLPWAVDSRVIIGDQVLATGVVYPEWTTVVPAVGAHCDEARWISVHSDPYAFGASTEHDLEVALAVLGEESNALPDFPLPHPVLGPAFELRPTDTDLGMALFGGTLSIDETAPDGVVVRVIGAERCIREPEQVWAACEPAGDVVLELDGPFHDIRNQGCYEGEPLDPWAGDGLSPCVPAGSGEPTGSNRIDCP